MAENVFLENKKKLSLAEYMNYNPGDRGNLGDELPVIVYRLMEYSMREQLTEEFGEEMQIRIFRSAGYKAGVYFAKKQLDITMPINRFIADLQARMEELKIGVLRVESFEEQTGVLILTVAEDVDCSGLPLLGETVCNYDEGFISGIMSTYMKKEYMAEEVDCWATGDRVCRFRVAPVE
ncbi:MAG: 4-vinyl reductase [Faecalicatena sp.]|uniref:V4R domain-containing protein n=1 Tax=Faecalicatena sp. TaxID=2005360 RepID=UPI0025910D0C|nr:V4R domain-containing protein [Faecalicatena sp.]MCI6465628.1 4-vinyl reductase [Faecalicatena sp.]MDY5618099.1 V4R domain-containing protein [Lachnospiraceae bacterium]